MFVLISNTYVYTEKNSRKYVFGAKEFLANWLAPLLHWTTRGCNS